MKAGCLVLLNDKSKRPLRGPFGTAWFRGLLELAWYCWRLTEPLVS